MKIKIILLFALCLVLAVISATVYCFVKSFILACVILSVILAVIAYSFTGLLLYRRFIKSRLIDPKINLKRNYRKLLLGEIDSSLRADKETLDLRGYHRNAYTDILLTERYYGFLALDGCVKIYTASSSYYRNSERISPTDYLLLHPVTLMEHGISSNNRKFAQFNPIIGAMFLNSLIICFVSKKKNSSSTKAFEDLISFCEQRNINIRIL